ncbi:MAG: hypothetical protein MZU97_05790 [Bacillus subtilis]|nr:hypothetical protein [Bacillus subtilis]
MIETLRRPSCRHDRSGTPRTLGKTTVSEFADFRSKRPKSIGVTSIGLDGEELDQITHLPKPRITPFARHARRDRCRRVLAAAACRISNASRRPPSIRRRLGDDRHRSHLEAKAAFSIAGPSDRSQMHCSDRRGLYAITVRTASTSTALSRASSSPASATRCVLVVGAQSIAFDIDRVVRHAVCTIAQVSASRACLSNLPSIRSARCDGRL